MACCHRPWYHQANVTNDTIRPCTLLLLLLLPPGDQHHSHRHSVTTPTVPIPSTPRQHPSPFPFPPSSPLFMQLSTPSLVPLGTPPAGHPVTPPTCTALSLPNIVPCRGAKCRSARDGLPRMMALMADWGKEGEGWEMTWGAWTGWRRPEGGRGTMEERLKMALESYKDKRLRCREGQLGWLRAALC